MPVEKADLHDVVLREGTKRAQLIRLFDDSNDIPDDALIEDLRQGAAW